VAQESQDLPLFREVILTAPDIDAEIFKRDIAPAIVKTADRVTLYASSNDEALAVSKTVNGGPRAGDSGSGIVVVPGLETIDVSAVDTSLLGHSYYGENGTVLSDIFFLLRRGLPASRRPNLVQEMHLGLPYWVMRPESARLPTDGLTR
jgi:esterase/lipase superfamily enzyme